MMDPALDFVEKLKLYGVGRRKLEDDLFTMDKPPPRLGIYGMDDENLCHDVIKMTCNIPSCNFTTESLLAFEDHYNATHRYSCAQCKRMLPSPHLLDLHLQERHDSFFAVMAEKKPSYCCYTEECTEKFKTAEERHDHCVKVHKLPKDFRFEQMDIKNRKKANKTKHEPSMDTVNDTKLLKDKNKVIFSNNKQKIFPKYTGRKFTQNSVETKNNTEMDISTSELKETLPK